MQFLSWTNRFLGEYQERSWDSKSLDGNDSFTQTKLSKNIIERNPIDAVRFSGIPARRSRWGTPHGHWVVKVGQVLSRSDIFVKQSHREKTLFYSKKQIIGKKRCR